MPQITVNVQSVEDFLQKYSALLEADPNVVSYDDTEPDSEPLDTASVEWECD